MRLPLILILPLLILGILVDWYICRRCRSRIWRRLAACVAVVCNAVLLLVVCLPKTAAGDDELVGLMWVLYAYFSIYIPKYIFVLFDLVGAIPRLWHGARLKGLGVVGATVGAVVFVLMWWGALFNRFNIDVRRVDFVDSRLPAAFEGLTMAQISDLHVGTFGHDTSFVTKLVDSINALQPDIVVFTGDIVNRKSSELEPFVSALSRLSAPLGVYAILGNHDYGDYYRWSSAGEKQKNMELLYELYDRIGWDLIRNGSRTISAGADSVVIIGVENIGDPPFPVYGDLDGAYRGALDDPAFKILLSHNPAHWVEDIAESPDKNIALTLSGHTHAMQMEAFGLSPAAFRYPTWGGMYADGDGSHRMYVNIGAGEVGIPARIGATPEITLFTFRR